MHSSLFLPVHTQPSSLGSTPHWFSWLPNKPLKPSCSPTPPERVVLIPNSEMWDSNPVYIPPQATCNYPLIPLSEISNNSSRSASPYLLSTEPPSLATRLLIKYQMEVLWKMAGRDRGRREKKDTREIKSLGIIWHVAELAITTPLS